MPTSSVELRSASRRFPARDLSSAPSTCMPHPPRRCQLFLFRHYKVWSFDSLPPPERVIHIHGQPRASGLLASAEARVAAFFVTVLGSACFASAPVCVCASITQSVFPKRGANHNGEYRSILRISYSTCISSQAQSTVLFLFPFNSLASPFLLFSSLSFPLLSLPFFFSFSLSLFFAPRLFNHD
ncbi:hypothetical protein J3F84DRAFT_148900 [Trichoderma pleuroticola]